MKKFLALIIIVILGVWGYRSCVHKKTDDDTKVLKQVKVTALSANLRTGPGTNYDYATVSEDGSGGKWKLKRGTVLEVVSESGDWYEVRVVGGSSARDFKTSYAVTGAAIVTEFISDMDCGEGYDRSTLRLLGKQEELMERIYATGKPVVTVYIQGRPVDMNLANEKSNALLTLWYPGMEGGSALADILWGDYNPAGRLPISIPRSVGQIPVYYSQPSTGDYVEESARPLFPFGYGLSYTQFEYSDLKVEAVSAIDSNRTTSARNDKAETMSAMSFQCREVGSKESMADTICVVSCTVKNIGSCNGDEVVHLYVRDEVASIAPASKLLKGFQRVHINKGETQQVTFYLTQRDLAVYSKEKGWHVEPGEFTIMVGGCSDVINGDAMNRVSTKFNVN